MKMHTYKMEGDDCKGQGWDFLVTSFYMVLNSEHGKCFTYLTDNLKRGKANAIIEQNINDRT